MKRHPKNPILIATWTILAGLIILSGLYFVNEKSSPSQNPATPGSAGTPGSAATPAISHAAQTILGELQSSADAARPESEVFDPYAATDKVIDTAQIKENTMEDFIYSATPDIIIFSLKSDSTATAESPDFQAYFRSFPIQEGDAVYNRIHGKSYVENKDIKLESLRYIRLLHFDYNHNVRLGELIVNESIVDKLQDIFLTFYQEEYEIESMRLIDDFWTGNPETSDTLSISYNNSSAFCYRLIAGTSTLSNHALGLAIDINPRQNPYIRFDSKGNKIEVNDWDWDYMDRDSGKPHMILKGDLCESAFKKHGFTWGGDWKNPIDYQHFEFA